MMKASVIGLGKLGSPLAACLAARGLTVIGVDQDARKVEAINQGQPPVHEPGLAEMLAQSEGRLTATADIEAAVRDTQITFIVVSTPSDPAGGFSLRYVDPVCQAIGRALAEKKNSEYHLVCLTSTVMPGTTGGPVREMLEKASGKKMGADFGLCYSPEFIALGSVIRDFLNPDMLLIGESDARAGDLLQALYAQVCENKPSVARMAFVNAEVTKLAVNTYVTTKISYANMLARICERLPGANVDRFNRLQGIWLADLVQHRVQRGTHKRTQGTVGILGLTYKAGTDVVEEAVGFLLTKELASRGVKVLAFDPAYGKVSAPAEIANVSFAATAIECISKSDLVVLATSWPEFSAIPGGQWVRSGDPRTVIDCWRAVKFLHDTPGVDYLGLGIGEGFV
jgi:UDPglucose 6-dehydrogenase